MTFTLVSPTSGRIGPGCFFTLTDDLIGPYAPDAIGDFRIEETSTSRVLIRAQQFMAHTMFWTPGLHGPANFTNQRSATGTADGTAVQFHAFQTVSGGAPFADLVVTGFTWDAVSNAWELAYLNMGFLIGGLGSVASELAAIKAAVLHTYSTP